MRIAPDLQSIQLPDPVLCPQSVMTLLMYRESHTVGRKVGMSTRNQFFHVAISLFLPEVDQ